MKSSLSPVSKLLLLVTSIMFSPAIAAAQTPTPAPAEDEYQEEEVVVRGRFIPTPMRETAEVATFLSNEDLARQGDDNAAAALTRLTGLSVVSGRFVYVRGLGDRYSSALLNGSPLPSPEPLRRQVPLDLFPSNILEGATVQKTFSPNYPGEFGGGIIDLQTLRLPNEPFFTLKVGTTGNTESTDHRGFVYYGEGSDWSGISDGLRDLPAPLAAAIDTGLRITDSNFSGEDLETIGESFVNSPFTVVQSTHLDPDFEAEASGGASVNIGQFNLGLVGAVGYDSTWRTQRAERVAVVGDAIATDFDSAQTSWDIVTNGFGSVALGWDDQEVSMTGFIVRSTTKQAQVQDGFNVNDPTGVTQHVESTSWYERQLASLQFSGQHRFGALDIDWRTAFAQSTRDAPYERDITYYISGGVPEYSRENQNHTRFSYLTDEVGSAGIDAAYTIPLSDQRDLILSGGYAWSNTVRRYDLFSFVFTGPATATPNDVLQARVDYLFSPDNIDPLRFEITEFTGRDDSYKGRLTLNAAYLAADAEIIPLVRVAVGVRFEDATQIVRTGNRFGEAPFAPVVNIENSYALPAATVTWNFAEDLQMRFGYSQTIARPQFRELAFTPYIDPESGRTYKGLPVLQDTEFQNYDARVEYYFGQNQFVTLGGFYKQLENPIEEVIIPTGDGSSTLTTFLNAPEALLFGAEIEYRINFDMPFDVPLLSNDRWLFAANYTYTSSELIAEDGDLVYNPQAFPLPPGADPASALVPASQFNLDGSVLQGTPENIANVQFGFETDTSQLTLLVGWVDERIARRGLGALPTVYEDPGINIDLVFRRDFTVGDSIVTLGLSGRNLLDEDHAEFQNSAIGRTETNTYARGQSYSASLTAKF